MNHVEKAVAPLRQDAIKRAKLEAGLDLSAARSTLSSHRGNINKAAPYPSAATVDNAEFYEARFRHNLLHSVTTPLKSKPGFVSFDKKRGAQYVEQRCTEAAQAYDEFVAKLVTKIGATKSASLEGNHIWGQSTLTVVTAAGETQRWSIQQVTNTSKHGKLFYQWTTRRLKR